MHYSNTMRWYNTTFYLKDDLEGVIFYMKNKAVFFCIKKIQNKIKQCFKSCRRGQVTQKQDGRHRTKAVT